MEPTKEWIEESKKKYGKLSKSIISGQTFIYRKLTRKEHLDIQKEVFPDGVPAEAAMIKAEDNASIEDKIIQKCVLWPETLDVGSLDAGIAPNLVPSILYVSGFVPVTEPQEV